MAALALVAAAAPAVATAGPVAGLNLTAPTFPPAVVCGNAATLAGPVLPPIGSVLIDPGRNLEVATRTHPAGTTFWLSPGVHHLGPDEFSQVMPKDGNTYVGAPGAVIDGRGVNRYAFTQGASDVKIRHLTIQGFVPPPNEGVVNHDSGRGWVIERNTIRANSGAGVMLGSDNVLRHNCLADNGQYGLSAYHPDGVRNVTVERNELARNNADDWERRIPGCGCAGATKFWAVDGAVVVHNWVHDNRGPGIWADTNNVGFRIDNNLIEDNDGEAIFYEISYNARIANNTIRRNAVVKGKEFASRNDTFPIGAVYISESGGDARLNGGTFRTLDIVGNRFEDNWGGVVLWENADRFCGSPNNSSTGYCTLGGAGSLATCVPGTIDAVPYVDDCRWKTRNLTVRSNLFTLDKALIGCAPGAPCGRQALLANYGTAPWWSPYVGTRVSEAITFQQNNRFSGNQYVGDWRFNPLQLANIQSFPVWQAAFGQDAGSTLVPAATPLAQNGVGATGVPKLPGNTLDDDTSTIEGSTGQWIPWFSTSVSRVGERAHLGLHSLRVDVTAPWGWGVQLRNWPGFPAQPGPAVLTFWASADSGTMSVTMTVRWRNAAGADLAVETLTLTGLGPVWEQATTTVSAPEGTTLVSVEFTHPSGGPGDVVYLDDIFVIQ